MSISNTNLNSDPTALFQAHLVDMSLNPFATIGGSFKLTRPFVPWLLKLYQIKSFWLVMTSSPLLLQMLILVEVLL